MPNVVTEFVQSRTTTIGASPQHEKIYIVRGTDDESTALEAAWNTAANSFGGSGIFPYLTKKNATVEPTSVIEGNGNACIWTTTITYLRPQAGTGGGAEKVVTFDTGGGTVHITQSLGTQAANSVANHTANIADYDRAIGVKTAGGVEEIEGVDIVTRAFNFQETHYIADANVTANYMRAVAGVTGCVNDDDFRGYEKGEVLFLGVSGSKRDSDSLWEFTFKFSVQLNMTDVPVGSEMIFPRVEGWWYLWAQYAPYPKEDAKARQKPIKAFVEQVYAYTDFEILGIGVDE